jgi:Domain of unknown function (DUF4375)
MIPAKDYWTLVEPIWDTVSIHDGPEAFLRQYGAAPAVPRILFVAHWTESEVSNGGFDQYFSNSTGVLAPEAVAAFRQLGMPLAAAAIERAMAYFESPYPRQRELRYAALKAAWEANGNRNPDLFAEADDAFFDGIKTENGGFEAAANAYATAQG